MQDCQESEGTSPLCTEDLSSSETPSEQSANTTPTVTIRDPGRQKKRKSKRNSTASDDSHKRRSARRSSTDGREKRKRSRSRSRSRSRTRSRKSIKQQRSSTTDDPSVSSAIVRSRIVKEILDTELSYITALETLTENLAPFLELDMSELEDFPETEARTIHSNGGIILGYSKLLMEMLKPRVESFDEQTCIGDIFLRLADFMKGVWRCLHY